MADLSQDDFASFVTAAAARLQELHPDLSTEDAQEFAGSAVPPVHASELGILTLVAEDGRTLEVSLEDFDPYEILEALDA